MTTLTINPEQIGKALRSTSTLVQFTRTSWDGKVNDSRAVADIKSQNGASGDVGKFTKNLMAGADAELKAIHKLLGTAYNEHRRLTLPFSVEALRLMPVSRLGPYFSAMNQFTEQLQPLVDDFIGKYDQLVAKAQANLGGMFDRRDYPMSGHIRTRFSMNIKLHPIPSSVDWRELPVGPDMVASLEAHTQEILGNALTGAYDELRERTKAWAERAQASLAPHPDDPSKPAVMFHKTLLTDVHRLCTDLRDFNVTGDTELTELKNAMIDIAVTAGEEIETLKNSPMLRDEIHGLAGFALKIIEDYREGRAA